MVERSGSEKRDADVDMRRRRRLDDNCTSGRRTREGKGAYRTRVDRHVVGGPGGRGTRRGNRRLRTRAGRDLVGAVGKRARPGIQSVRIGLETRGPSFWPEIAQN